MVLDSQGAVLATTGLVDGAPLVVPGDLLAQATQAGTAQRTLPAGGGLRVHVRPWQRADRSGYVVTAQAASRLRTDQAGVVVIIVMADLIALLAASVAIWLATGRALRPLRQLATTADDVGRSADLTRRLPPVKRLDHLGRLTASFNAMMDRLQHAHARLSTALAAQQRFTADASHELRTPLATIRSNAGFLRAHPDADPPDVAAAVADIDLESQRMTRLVTDLLTLARADSSQPLAIGDIDLVALVVDVAAQASRTHPQRRFHTQTAAGPGTRRRRRSAAAAADPHRQRRRPHRRRRPDLDHVGSRTPPRSRCRSPTTGTAFRPTCTSASSAVSCAPGPPPGRRAPAWAWPSPVRWRRRTTAGSGPAPTAPEAPPSPSSCRLPEPRSAHRILNRLSSPHHRPPSRWPP